MSLPAMSLEPHTLCMSRKGEMGGGGGGIHQKIWPCLGLATERPFPSSFMGVLLLVGPPLSQSGRAVIGRKPRLWSWYGRSHKCAQDGWKGTSVPKNPDRTEGRWLVNAFAY